MFFPICPQQPKTNTYMKLIIDTNMKTVTFLCYI